MGLKLHFGCGSNRLAGWDNHDSEIDIARPLPFANDVTDAVFAEHVVEHLSIQDAFLFFEECHRILIKSGRIRICVPSVERIYRLSTPEYEAWLHDVGYIAKPDRVHAVKSIIFNHGHKSVWTTDILKIYLRCSGFRSVESAEIYDSKHETFKDTNGHHRSIGEGNNTIESIVVEGLK